MDEVFKIEVRHRYEMNKERQEPKIRDAQGTPKVISKKTQASKLGDAPKGIPSFVFNNYRYVSVGPMFLFVHMICALLGASFDFILVLFAGLCNHCVLVTPFFLGETHTGLMFIECSLIFTYIF